MILKTCAWVTAVTFAGGAGIRWITDGGRGADKPVPAQIEPASATETVPGAVPAPAPACAEPRPALESVFSGDDEHARLRRFVDYLAEATPDELTMLATLLDAQPENESGELQFWWKILYQRWVRVDGPGALAFARAKTLEGDSPFQGTYRVLEAWMRFAPADAMAAVDWSDKDEARAMRNTLSAIGDVRARLEEYLANQELWRGEYHGQVFTIFGKLAEEDLREAIQKAEQLTDEEDQWTAYRRIAEQFAIDDPVAALAWAQALPDGQDKQGLVQSLLESAAKNDPVKTAPMIGELPRGSVRAKSIRELMSRWAEEDPGAARAWLGANTAGWERLAGLSAVAMQLAKSDPRAAIEIIDEIGWDVPRENPIDGYEVATPGESGYGSYSYSDYSFEKAMATALRAFAEEDPLGAMKYADRIPPQNLNDPFNGGSGIHREIAETWMRKDPAAALSWLKEGIATGSASDAAVAQMALLWTRGDLGAAAAFAGSLPPETGNSLVKRVAEAWVQQDLESFAEWTRSPNNANGDRALASGIRHLAQTDAPSAAALVDLLPKDKRPDAARDVIYRWAPRDPEGAVAWLESAESPDSMSRSYRTAVSEWAEENPIAASEWLNSVPPGARRDASIMGMVDGRLGVEDQDADFEGLLAWSMEIGSDDQRSNVLKWLARNWEKAGSVGMRDSFRRAGIDRAQLEALMNAAEAD